MQDRLVTVYLVNGIKLAGKVRQHDQYTLLLQGADGIDSLIFKHAISTVIPGAPVVTRERRTPFGRRPEWTG
jgi:host factor-I protein